MYKCYVDVTIKMYLTVDGESAMLEAPSNGDVFVHDRERKHGLVIAGVESIGIKLPEGSGIPLGRMASGIIKRAMAATLKRAREYFEIGIIKNGD